MAKEALQDKGTPYRRLLGYAADLLVAAAVGVAVGYALNPHLGRHVDPGQRSGRRRHGRGAVDQAQRAAAAAG